ncbi:MAG TPA: cohesin domain-containing protein [Patescibacteria group bacterium]|jgi:hypothetical protein|nr:cohesin domain-containing protein [Patescibacteria group bacterium]
MKRIFTIITALLLLPNFSLAATLYLSPPVGNYSVGTTFKVKILANTEGQSVNTAEARINYPADKLELLSVIQGTTFYFAAPSSPSKNGGTAYFGGGLPNPGYTGNAGLLGTMTFRAKAAGTADVSISNGKVLLNDGKGTDALSTTLGSTFKIAEPAKAAPVAPTTPEETPPPAATPEVGKEKSAIPQPSNNVLMYIIIGLLVLIFFGQVRGGHWSSRHHRKTHKRHRRRRR